MGLNRKELIKFSALVIGGFGINILGGVVADFFSFPFYLDCIGTILAAVAGGYLPGILVGFFTNLVTGITDYTNSYYSIINIFIAVAAAYLTSKGWFKRSIRSAGKILLAALIFAFIGGSMGSLISWSIYGSQIGGEISADLATRLYHTTIHSEYLAELAADLAIDIPDKLISTIIALAIFRIIPSRLLPSKRDVDLHNKQRGLSLGTKLTILVSTAVLLVAASVSYVSYRQFQDTNIDRESEYARGVAEYAATLIDPDMVDTYLELGTDAPGYNELIDKLTIVYGSATKLQYLYCYKIDEEGCHVVFDLDTEDDTGFPPGSLIEFDESFSKYIPTLLAGEDMEPIVTNDTFGWLLTSYVPVYDDAGNCVCYVAADIAMPDLIVNEQIFVAKTITMLFGFFGVILAIGITLANLFIISPVNSLASTTEDFAYNDAASRNDAVEKIKSLNIHTGDEIEHLYHALEKTTQDTVDYITETQRQSAALETLQSAMIIVMADLVESRDPSTGTHIKNTADYVQIIADQLKADGIYADILTDDYIDDIVASAPLHDIGKIMVSDTILNKPGKLTDEEYEIMKTHTSEGAKIIQSVMERVGEDAKSGYLHEAENMAHYHHEKWNGKGYPEGLSGEDIPLSARIMAVADVFDALVSKRIYKPPFTFEQAMEIIMKDAGSHFDPYVAKAFEEASDKVRRITEETHA